ncbi:hypothetical protein ACHAW5_006875 [Stephanodiscus triporus]|uniref:Uncharacterized protein n=1 Tax=Stephanodiscus triporus TaxID=2934178 RepID=A0ABD3QVL0_9STRA
MIRQSTSVGRGTRDKVGNAGGLVDAIARLSAMRHTGGGVRCLPIGNADVFFRRSTAAPDHRGRQWDDGDNSATGMEMVSHRPAEGPSYPTKIGGIVGGLLGRQREQHDDLAIRHPVASPGGSAAALGCGKIRRFCLDSSRQVLRTTVSVMNFVARVLL